MLTQKKKRDKTKIQYCHAYLTEFPVTSLHGVEVAGSKSAWCLLVATSLLQSTPSPPELQLPESKPF